MKQKRSAKSVSDRPFRDRSQHRLSRFPSVPRRLPPATVNRRFSLVQMFIFAFRATIRPEQFAYTARSSSPLIGRQPRAVGIVFDPERDHRRHFILSFLFNRKPLLRNS